MNIFAKKTTPDASAEDIFSWYSRKGALAHLSKKKFNIFISKASGVIGSAT